MRLVISKAVRASLPELTITYVEIETPLKVPSRSTIQKSLETTKLSNADIEAYKKFRIKIAGNTKLAVERLRTLGEHRLPRTDRLTDAVILASYSTNLPVTVFSADHLKGQLNLRYAMRCEYLNKQSGVVPVSAGSLVAADSEAIIGLFGIKSSQFGKLTGASKHLVILSFGVTRITEQKSRQAVSILRDLFTEPGVLTYNGGKNE